MDGLPVVGFLSEETRAKMVERRRRNRAMHAVHAWLGTAGLFLGSVSPAGCNAEERGDLLPDVRVGDGSSEGEMGAEDSSAPLEAGDEGSEAEEDTTADTAAVDVGGDWGDAATDGDGSWPSCDAFGEFCLREDAPIFVASCRPVEGGPVRFSPDGTCGVCVCGFVEKTGPCADEGGPCTEDSVERPLHLPSFCASGRRVLCANGTGEYTHVRIGCCDEEGWVYCERDPAPGSNGCA
jgi:hypothetical protein